MIEGEYLSYPVRRLGLDHDWFAHRSPGLRPTLRWPDEGQMALWITVPLEFFPMDGSNAPFRSVGALDRPYPDLWGYASRDYGLRIGIYRILRALDQRGLKATAAVNAAVARRSPELLEMLAERRWEVMCAGVDMGALHHGGLEKDTELELIKQALADMRRTKFDVVGWHSPAHSQSMHTMELLAREGVRYVADWVNDDLPYDVQTPGGNIVAMPLSYELADRKAMFEHDRTMDDYVEMVLAAARRLRAESAHGARILSLSVSPWLIGYPHRIAGFERLLDSILEGGPVWVATGRELFDAYQDQKT